MTVEQLLEYCQKQVAKGNGKKVIYIPSDDEWNEWHELLFSFIDNLAEIKDTLDSSNTDKLDIERYHKLEDIILLG